MPQIWFSKEEVVAQLRADGCKYSESYLSQRVGFVRDILQHNKHYVFGEMGKILYSPAGYEKIKEILIEKERV